MISRDNPLIATLALIVMFVSTEWFASIGMFVIDTFVLIDTYVLIDMFVLVDMFVSTHVPTRPHPGPGDDPNEYVLHECAQRMGACRSKGL